MALHLPCFLWLILAFISIFKVYGIADVDTMLNHASFICGLRIKESNWSMQCNSNNFDLKTSSKFFVSKLRGTLNNDKPLIFKDILYSTTLNNSEFYLCDSEWRYFIIKDPSMLSSNCIKKKKLKRLISLLNESSLIKVQISHVKEPQFIMNVLSNCSKLLDISISKSPISQMSFLPIGSNNTVKILSLKENSIQLLSDGLFTKLNNLQTLDLSHNLLKSINKTFFNGITNIIYLDLSNNVIEYIFEGALSNLTSLQSISLRNNKLQNIDKDMFKYNRFLSIIDISDNDFKSLPSSLFHNMHNLKNVSCSNCSLFNLDKNIFKNCSNLVRILCKHNKIQFLHPDIFKDLNFLEIVELSNNNLLYFNGTLFPNHPYLMYVNISHNRISELNLDVFRGARNVRYLDFNSNRITSDVTDDYIKNFTDIEVFVLHHNMITTIELGLTRPVRVRKLDASYNLITKLTVRWKQLIMIEQFNLNNNFLTSLDLPPCIPNMKQTLTFSFQYNRISNVNMDALLFDEHRVKSDKTMTCFFNGLARNFVDLTNNPLNCDCKMYPFYKYIREKSPRRYQIEIFINKGNITCDKPDFLINQTLASLPDDMLNCALNDQCPQFCSCGIRGKDDSIFVNCSSKGLQEIPRNPPDDTTVLYFNKNLLKSMDVLNNNSWCNLVEIHLDYNLLSNLDNWEFPLCLRYLSVRGNLLKTLPYPLMQFISNQTNFRLYFGNNDFNCDCDRKSLKNFLRENIEFVEDNENILCNLTNNNTYELLPLTSVFDSVLCLQEIKFSKQISIITILCVLFSVFILTLLIYYRKRHLMISYFYVRCRFMYDIFYNDAVDDDAVFDAFVAYSSTDREIMLQLIEELENNPPFFQLCIHERNWLPGRFITDNIAESVEISRRTIVILSNTFLTSPWFNVELRAAMCKMAQDALNRIIIILTDKNLSLDSIDPELRYVVSKRTYLEWGERWFWEKLRYALPRKSIKEAKLDNRVRGSISELALLPNKTENENDLDE